MGREILVKNYDCIENMIVAKTERTKEEKDLEDFLLVLLLNYFKKDMILWYFYNLKGVCYRDLSIKYNIKKETIGKRLSRINSVIEKLSHEVDIQNSEIQFFKNKKKISKNKAIVAIKFLKILYPKQYQVFCYKKIYFKSLNYIQNKCNIKTKKTVYDNCDKINHFLKFKKNDYNKFFI